MSSDLWGDLGQVPPRDVARRHLKAHQAQTRCVSSLLILSYSFSSKLARRKSAGRSISELVGQEAEEAKVILQLKSPAPRLPDHKDLRL